MNVGLGADGLHRRAQAVDLGHKTGLPGGHILTGHNAELDRKAAIGCGDVVGGATLDHADMQGGEGRIVNRGQRSGRFCADLGVEVVDPLDQPRALHDRRDAVGQQRGMDLEPLHVHEISGAALVAGDDGHAAWLADDGGACFRHNVLHGGDHRGRTGAAHLFVIRQHKLQRAANTAVLRLDQRADGQRHKTLHVAGAATIKATVPFGHGPGVGRPGLAIHRHHIGMSRQHDSPRHPGAGMGDQGGLLAILVPVAEGADAMAAKIAFQPVDQGQIRLIADRRKADKRVKNLTRRQCLHIHPRPQFTRCCGQPVGTRRPCQYLAK